MSRSKRIGLIMAGSFLGLILLVAVSAVIIAQTTWFRNFVRERIISVVETATGGRVEIRSFRFYWRHLRAEVRNFIIHGAEPAAGPPLLRAGLVQVDLKIVSVFKKDIDIAALVVRQPSVYLLIYPDGRTNVPEPRIKKTSKKSGLETILDLAIRRFSLEDGWFELASKKTPFDARGENLRAQFYYDLIATKYSGTLDIHPLRLASSQILPADVNVNLAVDLEKDRVQVSPAKLATGRSEIDISGYIEHLVSPRGELKLNARLAAEEWARTLKLPLPWRGGRPPEFLNVEMSARMDANRLHLKGARLAFGHSRAEASGVVDDLSRMQGAFAFKSRLALEELARRFAIRGLESGAADVNGHVKLQGPSGYLLMADVHGRDIAAKRGNIRVTGVGVASQLQAAPGRIELDRIELAALGGTFTGTANIENMRRFRLDGKLNHFDIQRVASVAGSPRPPWDGIISGPVHAEGPLKGSRLVASGRVAISPAGSGAPVRGLLDVTYDAPRDTLSLANSFLALPNTRLDFSGSLGTQINVRLVSTNLNDLLPAVAMAVSPPPKSLPIHLEKGSANFNGAIRGKLSAPQISGHIAANSFVYQDQRFDRFSADVAAQPSGARVENGSITRGKMQAQFAGSIGLREWKPQTDQPVSATASIRGAEIRDLTALAGQNQPAPVQGTLAAEARVSGTVGAPDASADISITKGLVYQEPFDRLDMKITASSKSVELRSAQLAAGPAQVNFTAAFTHPRNDFAQGRLQFDLSTSGVNLARLKSIEKLRAGLAGDVQLKAAGIAELRQSKTGKSELVLSSLNANLSARGVELEKKQFGDLNLAATTRGSDLLVQLDSDFAKTQVHGSGKWRLEGDYPGTARVDFSRVDFASLNTLLANGESRLNFGGSAQADLTIAGPALKPENLKAALNIPGLEITPPLAAAVGRPGAGITLRNDGPIRITVANSIARIESLRLRGRETNLSATGTVSLKQKNAIDVRVSAGADLALLENFNRDLVSSGAVVLEASVRGSLSQPQLGGQLHLKNAALNVVDLPNGLSKANGLILFDGTRATIQELTGETGGGKVNLKGFIVFSGNLTCRLEATASQVRVRMPEGASAVANANLAFSGTSKHGLISGEVTVLKISFNPHSDLGSILAKTAQPVTTPSIREGPLAALQFDVQIQTAPDIIFETALTQGLQAEANLRLRGTVSNPALLGRISITQGQIVFFGTKYNISQGTISFFNPVKLEPILNIDLETKVRGIDVTLTVSGPINKMTLTHRSDPPLQSSELIALLATGRTPDQALAARQSAQPSQSWQQMGASALLGEAIANPVSGRLQRFFGVTQLRIDPTLTGVENNPQARLTLEQQVSNALTFTYITNLTRSNPQVVRVEWALSKEWSAVALREESGLFGLDFLYKKRFK